MKFPLATVLVIFASAVVPSFAAPVPSLDSDFDDILERDDFDFVEELEACAVSATAQAMVTWLQSSTNSATINAKPVCFYSGFTVVRNTKLKPPTEVKITALGKLDAFTGTQGCASINNIVAAAGRQKDSLKWTGEDWAAVSAAVGRSLTRSTKTLLGMTVAGNAVWITHELPALRANARVPVIEQYLIDASGAIVKKANLKGWTSCLKRWSLGLL